MNLPCELVQDLLPLYEDQVCSPASKAHIEQHLADCPACRALLERSSALPQIPPQPVPQEDRAVKRSFRKVRRRWWTSLVAVLLLIPTVLLSVNQYRGQGICFTNLDDVWAARRYCVALAEGDFERAAGYMDCQSLYTDVQEVLSQSADGYLTDYRLITIGGQDYAATPAFDMVGPDETADPLDLWGNIVFNGVWGCMVPEEVWAEVIAMEPGAAEVLSPTVTQVNGHSFTRLETDWGVYYVCDDVSGELTAENLANSMQLLPATIWTAAQDALAVQAGEDYAFNQRYYAAAKDMTYEEFEVFVRSAYAEKLQALADRGYAFALGGVETCYHNGAWVVMYALTLTGGDTPVHLSLHISVEDAGLSIGAMSSSPELPQLDLAEYLFFHYPGET